MNFTTTSSVGIDVSIKSIQTDIYDFLIDRWVDDIDGYGRVYKNPKGTGFVPKYYISENDYKDVYWNDEKSGQFFFITDDNSSTSDELVFTNSIKVVFIVDLTKIISTGREDETARRDAIESIRNVSYENFKITGIDVGVENVFRGFDFSSITNTNINPLHTFSINLDLNYYLTDKCE